MLKAFLLLAAFVSLGLAAPSVATKTAHAKTHPTPQGAAAAAAPAAPATTFAALAPEAQAKVKSLYKMDCELCHGADGNGQTEVAKSMQLVLDNWTDGKILAAKSDQVLFDMIRKGTDKMPPEPSGRATDTEVRNLVLYIRSMAKEHPDVVPAAAPAAPAANPGT
ncbi:MAG TPA: cytochrome c [Terracidiphilus sp.]|nr:cytochrome c [Terracidiphilus sp.]